MVVQSNQGVPCDEPVAQVEEQPKTKAKSYRFKNFVVLLIALIGMYLILLPEQFNLLKNLNLGLIVYATEGMPGITMTGWDMILALLSNFGSQFASLSTVATNYQFNSIEFFIAGVLVSLAVLDLAIIILAKLFGVLTGKTRKGIDKNAIFVTIVTAGAFAYAYFHGINTISCNLYLAVVPEIFLMISIFNSRSKKTN